MTLKELKIGKSAIVTSVGGDGALRQHFLDMGIIPGTKVTLMKYAPMGDPMQLMLHGYLLTLRLDDASKIGISLDVPDPLPQPQIHDQIEHPGLGEGGRYHEEEQKQLKQNKNNGRGLWCQHEKEKFQGAEQETSDNANQRLTFALVGNQNCGKTTLFNQLTGSNQHVGNFPGVTVDRKSGPIKGYPNTELTDLPGIYSLSPYSAEEIVSRQFILEEKPSAIINILDATNIERNLYLTMQLMELGVPVVLALNMMDEVTSNSGSILINAMEQALGVPVVPISAAKNEGVQELIQHAIHIAKYQEVPQRQDFCDAHEHGGAMHRSLHAVMHLIEDHAQTAQLPIRFAASKVIEGDSMVIEALKLAENERKLVGHILRQLEEERGLDPAAAVADMRYGFIKQLCSKCVIKPRRSREQRRSEIYDKVLTGRFTALPAFLLIMGLIFWLTFNVIGDALQGWFEEAIDYGTSALDTALSSLQVNEVVHSLVIDGICAGIGSVLSFLPIIILLFFFLSMLEDSGYMARIAFVMDKLLRRIGLSGRSIVPMLIGFGCSVPAVMSTRTLPSERDRRLTILLTPFMSCTAKLPVYAFFCAAFFPHHGGMIMFSLYIIGIMTGVLLALLFKNSLFKGEAVPFVMELPCYRMPGARNVLMLLWDKAWDFLQRAFSVIFIASIVIWFLQHFDFRFSLVDNAAESILASIAGLIAPLFRPLGFGEWQWVTALVSGFMAKESVVSTLGVLFPDTQSLFALLNPVSCYVLLVFCLLYTPCVAAIAAIRRELGSRWARRIVIFQCVIAWVCAFLVKLLLGLFV